MKRAIYPGSFDPITLGHEDLIKRAAATVDELIVAVLVNPAKNPLFSVDERVKMIKEVTGKIPNVRVESFDGLLADFARKENAQFIVRGLRMVTDFESEMQMAQTNHVLNENIDTIFFVTSLKYSYLSSTTVRETAAFGGDYSKFVSPEVYAWVERRMRDLKS